MAEEETISAKDLESAAREFAKTARNGELTDEDIAKFQRKIDLLDSATDQSAKTDLIKVLTQQAGVLNNARSHMLEKQNNPTPSTAESSTGEDLSTKIRHLDKAISTLRLAAKTVDPTIGEPTTLRDYADKTGGQIKKLNSLVEDAEGGLSEYDVGDFKSIFDSLRKYVPEQSRESIAKHLEEKMRSLSKDRKKYESFINEEIASIQSDVMANNLSDREAFNFILDKKQMLEKQLSNFDEVIKLFGKEIEFFKAPIEKTQSAAQTSDAPAAQTDEERYEQLSKKSREVVRHDFDVRNNVARGNRTQGSLQDVERDAGMSAENFATFSHERGIARKEGEKLVAAKYEAQRRNEIAEAAEREAGFQAHHQKNVEEMPIWDALHRGDKAMALAMFLDPKYGHVVVDEYGNANIVGVPRGVRIESTTAGIQLFEGGKASIHSSNNSVLIGGVVNGKKIESVSVDIQNDPMKQAQYALSEQRTQDLQTIALAREIEGNQKLHSKAQQAEAKIAAMGPEYAAMLAQARDAVRGENIVKASGGTESSMGIVEKTKPLGGVEDRGIGISVV